MKINIKNTMLMVIAMNIFMACESNNNENQASVVTESRNLQVIRQVIIK